VHNNFYFLRALATELAGHLRGFTLVSCFSQTKDELVIEFNNGEGSVFLKASLLPELQCLSFPSTFRRARKNSIDLFNEILMKPVSEVHVFRNERSLGIRLGEEHELIFKMHGQQANVILLHDGKVVSVFRNNFPADQSLDPDTLHRDIDWRFEAFQQHQHDLVPYYATFGNLTWEYLNEQGFSDSSVTERWTMIERLLQQLNHPTFTIVKHNDRLRLSLLPVGQLVSTYTNPMEAITEFFIRYLATAGFDRKKSALLAAIRGRIGQAQSFLEKNIARLSEVQHDAHYKLWGDLVMANLHRIKSGSSAVDLEDFQEPGKIISIKLKKDFTPQRNAEVFYRKAKNRSIEITKLQETVQRKQAELEKLKAQEIIAVQAVDSKTLEPLLGEFSSQAKAKEQKLQLPYHEHSLGGFRIWVGKNAKANDELTLHHTYKEDLWLHARDVAGSHVVIKHQAGKAFPKEVIEFAASLAAYHSKRKTESLCPVAVTAAKYVRKRKGDPPGAMVVQREEVLMVVPRKGA